MHKNNGKYMKIKNIVTMIFSIFLVNCSNLQALPKEASPKKSLPKKSVGEFTQSKSTYLKVGIPLGLVALTAYDFKRTKKSVEKNLYNSFIADCVYKDFLESGIDIGEPLEGEHLARISEDQYIHPYYVQKDGKRLIDALLKKGINGNIENNLKKYVVEILRFKNSHQWAYPIKNQYYDIIFTDEVSGISSQEKTFFGKVLINDKLTNSTKFFGNNVIGKLYTLIVRAEKKYQMPSLTFKKRIIGYLKYRFLNR